MAHKIIPLVAVGGMILFASQLLSQTQTTGRIAGTVRDAQGAVIVGAEVAIENPATADARSVISDDAGSYSIPFLAPARYELKIQAKGFTSGIFHNVCSARSPCARKKVQLSRATLT